MDFNYGYQPPIRSTGWSSEYLGGMAGPQAGPNIKETLMSQVWHNTVQLVLHGTRDWVTATYRLSIGDVSKWRPKKVELWKRHSEISLYIMVDDCDWQLWLMILDEVIWLRIGSLEWITLLYTQQCSPTIIMNTASHMVSYGIIMYHHHLPSGNLT